MRRALILLLLAAGARSESLGPGSYEGWLVKDRWGERFLLNGPHLLPLAEDVRLPRDLPAGKPVRLEVARFGGETSLDPSIEEVEGAEAVAVSPEHDVAIEVSEAIRGRKLTLTIRVERRETFRFRCRDLRVVLRGRSEEPTGALGATDAEGAPWTADGRSWRAGSARWVWRAPGGDLETTGPFKYEIRLEAVLPAAGAYEAYVVYGDTNASGPPGGVSRLVPLDAR